MNRRILLSLLSVTALAACATASGPEFNQLQTVSADKGNLYLYRKSAIYAMAAQFDVLDDKNAVIAGLTNASYVILPLAPGKHSFSVAEGGFSKPKSFEVQIEAGKNYFVEYDSSRGILLGWGLLSDVGTRNSEQALADLKGLKRNN